tara:strand:+ start:2305 stop:3258 length:954 start_codon:yes stop_codon:yes gene_type:complete
MAAFTAVAAGVGLAVTAATTAISFAQAAEQSDKKKKAEESAAAAMMEARKKLDVNYYEQLSIQKEPYELARRELLSQGALATQQLAEGDPRALAAGVGRVQLAQQMGQEKVATAMQHEQTALEKLVAGEDSRLRDLGAQLDLQEVVGAQQAMSDAERAESMAVQQGLAGVTSMVGQVASLAPLYSKTPGSRQFNQLENRMQRTTGQSSQQYMGGVDPTSMSLNQDQSKLLNQAGSIAGMSKSQYTDFMGQFSPEYMGTLEATMSYDAKASGMEKRQNKLRYYPSEGQTSKYYDKFNKTTPLKYVDDNFNFFNPYINR